MKETKIAASVKCPNCDAALAAADLDSGWCEECGHKVPHFVYTKSGARAPDEKPLPALHWDRPPAGPTEEVLEPVAVWKLAVLGIAALGIAVVIVLAFV